MKKKKAVKVNTRTIDKKNDIIIIFESTGKVFRINKDFDKKRGTK